MKNLLVPTDFSTTADNAVDFAIALANKLSYHVILLHSIKVHKRAGMLISIEDMLQEEAISSMEPVQAKVQNALNPGLEVSSYIVKGRVTEEIAEIADKKRVDFIVMGTEGASGLKEFLVGSKTAKVVQETGIPVLAIPASCRFNGIKKIALAMDSKEIEHPEVFLPLVAMADMLGTKVLVYHFETEKEDEGMDPDIGEILKKIEHSFHYDLVGSDVNAALDAFVVDYQVDMICMVKRKRDFLSEIFHESATTQELYHARLPVLVLKET